MNDLKSFFFNKASYRLGDNVGNEITLAIDYKNARFELRELMAVQSNGMKNLKRKAAKIARDLILRKHNVNFSARIAV